MATVLFSYSHVDEDLRDRLEKNLTMLKRQRVIETFHDRRIAAGNEVDSSISAELERADVILLLVSTDFLASAYCYDIEMKRALERHELGEARVIPVILRPCEWKEAPFGKIMATPRDGKPITSFPDLDEAFLQVTQAIRQAVTGGSKGGRLPPVSAQATIQSLVRPQTGPRSSNLRLPRAFTDSDRDRFRDDAFEYIAKYFENSLGELAERNPGIDVNFRRIDANQFTATGYKNGKKASWCRIFSQHGMMGSGIAFSANESIGTGGFNESLSVNADAEGIYLKPLGVGIRETSGLLTFEGAAELYWEMFIDNLRR
jgi:TIR domain